MKKMFLSVKGDLIEEGDLMMAAKVNGDEYSEDYWRGCKGILRPAELTIAGRLVYGEKTPAIKMYRDAVGCSLKKALEAVDALKAEIERCERPEEQYRLYN